ncbi:hypothetical protein EON77_01695 [bacterium]|nr:MAG: hypothetical protein EON77_01695 [bacterium]
MPRRSRARFRKMKRWAALGVALAAIPLAPKTTLTGPDADGDLGAMARALVRRTVNGTLASVSNAPLAILGLSERAELRYVSTPVATGENRAGLAVRVRWRVGARWNEVALTDPAPPDRGAPTSHSRARAR